MQPLGSSRIGRAPLWLGLLGLGLTTALAATQHPDATARRDATEVLKLTVRQVHLEKETAGPKEPRLVEIAAQVMEVRESRSKLHPGEMIIIRYWWDPNGEDRARKASEADFQRGMTGDMRLYEPYPPAADDQMMAYLQQHYDDETQNSKVYYPSAGQYSFLVLKSKLPSQAGASAKKDKP